MHCWDKKLKEGENNALLGTKTQYTAQKGENIVSKIEDRIRKEHCFNVVTPHCNAVQGGRRQKS